MALPADQPGFGASLLAGGVAGVSVDLILFPLDTIKTRLQSPQGFTKAGGFRGIYAGVPSAAIGSFPNAAAFFITYEYTKFLLRTDSSSYLVPVTHMLAASAGEVVACLIRVPSEVVKQRAQVSAASGTFHIFSNILYQEGIQGLYRGYKSTVLREIPFSLVQFPLWEALKVDLQQPSPHLLTWQKQGLCWQRWVLTLPVEMFCLPCSRSGRHKGSLDYLQALSHEWQQSAWGVSSFLALTTRHAVCCFNLAKQTHESSSKAEPPFFPEDTCFPRPPCSRASPHLCVKLRLEPCSKLSRIWKSSLDKITLKCPVHGVG
uniref:Mitochondrial S-adenosylmethionine carrier protein n=1 Tax=Sarcophilus harrisii TaxID=9305 RepID=A0A7N4PZ81_SARHA